MTTWPDKAQQGPVWGGKAGVERYMLPAANSPAHAARSAACSSVTVTGATAAGAAPMLTSAPPVGAAPDPLAMLRQPCAPGAPLEPPGPGEAVPAVFPGP